MQISELKRSLPISDQFRMIPVGESATVKVEGNMYVLIHATRTRLQKAGVGLWKLKYDRITQTMTVSRLQ